MKKLSIRRTAAFAVAGAMLLCGAPVIPAVGGAAGFGAGQVYAAESKAAEFQAAPAFQWAENGGGSYTDAYQNVAYTKDGGFVVSGYTFGDSASPAWTFEQAAPSNNHKNNDAVLVKYDKNHRIEWSRAYGGTGVEVFEAIDVLKDGTIAAAGREVFSSSGGEIAKVSWKVMLIDPKNPDQYETYHIGGVNGDQAYGIAATEDGGFVVGGWSSSKAGYLVKEGQEGVTQLWEAANGTDEAIPNRVAEKGSDSVVVKMDRNGTPQFCALHNYAVMEKAYTVSTPSENLTSLAVDEKGDILIAGNGSVAKHVDNAVIAKLSGKDGSLLWHRSAGRADMTTAPEDAADYIKAEYSDAAVLADGSYVAIGASSGDATTEEGWQMTAEKDTILAHYSKDGKLIHAESFGRINDSNSRPEGVTATPDGGYILCGSQSGVLYEDDLIVRGYDFGNYGAQDAILVKYNADDSVSWAENYGTTSGDWINGTAVGESGEIIAVGESNGTFGQPSYGNNGGVDGIVMISDGTSGQGSSGGIVVDGDLTWADGVYEGIGNGYGGEMNIQVVIKDGKITYVSSTKDSETEEFFYDAAALFDRIVEQQTAELDAVSGATLSSNGILEGTSRALSKAGAAHVDKLIEAIGSAEDSAKKKEAAEAAAQAWGQLGTYALQELKQGDALKAAAAEYGIALNPKSDVAQIEEMTPALSGQLTHSDRYYKIQVVYYSKIRAEGLRDHGYTGSGVVIAVIDSGITGAHQDLDYSRILDGWDYGDGKSYDEETAPGQAMPAAEFYDNNGHGTAVTGILQATTDNGTGITGLLSEAAIVPLRVLPATGKNEAQKISSSKQVARAILDAVDKYKVDVITTSLDVVDTEELKAAVAHAAESGVIITGASGNSSSADSDGNDPYIYPAAYDEVISVGAVDKNNRVRTSSQKNDQVFTTAPGENVALLDLSRNTRCKISSGTSYASPVVAAMAAAAKQRMAELSGHKEDLSPELFRNVLQATCMDAGEEGYDTSYGYGIVDLEAFAQRLDSAEDLAEVAVASVSEDLEQLREQVTQAKGLLEEAQAAVNGLAEDATEEERTQAQDALTQAQNAVTSAEDAVREAEQRLNEALQKQYPSIGEEISDLKDQLEDLTGQLAQAQIIDITYYAASLEANAFEYTGKAIEPAVSVPGLDQTKGDFSVTYENNTGIGTAAVTITANEANGFKGTITKSFEITKKANVVNVKNATKKIKAKKLRKKARSFKLSKLVPVKGAKGKVTYTAAPANGKAKKALKYKNGKVTVKKKTKKGSYKLKVTVKDAGSKTYLPASKTVTLTIKVK